MTILKKLHAEKVNDICNQLQRFYRQKKTVRIYHGSTNSTRTQKFQKDAIVDVSNLNQIISINTGEQYVIVEPNVSMDKLVKKTLEFELIPPVVMELPGITVGGGIQGGAGESSSFKWGAFHHTCLEYEMVLGNGEKIIVSPKKNTDLYWGTASSYGTLGIITQVKLKLIPAKKFVHLTYQRTNSFSESIDVLKKTVKESLDFIDGILFSRESGVIMTGMLSDEKILPVVTFGKASDDWFYIHAEKIMKKHPRWEELIPLEEYLFRYNRGAFWVGKYAFKKMKLPFNRFTRFSMNPLMKTRTLYRFLQAINISQRLLIQDLCLPEECSLPVLEYIDKNTGIYPLWLCPLKPGKFDLLSPLYIQTDLVIDIGIWGKVNDNYEDLLKLNRDVEQLLETYKGRKVLYAHAYYPKDEFWKIYDLKWYTSLREKYHAKQVFPDIYEKTYVSEKYEISLIKGLLNVLKSPFKLPVS